MRLLFHSFPVGGDGFPALFLFFHDAFFPFELFGGCSPGGFTPTTYPLSAPLLIGGAAYRATFTVALTKNPPKFHISDITVAPV